MEIRMSKQWFFLLSENILILVTPSLSFTRVSYFYGPLSDRIKIFDRV